MIENIDWQPIAFRSRRSIYRSSCTNWMCRALISGSEQLVLSNIERQRKEKSVKFLLPLVGIDHRVGQFGGAVYKWLPGAYLGTGIDSGIQRKVMEMLKDMSRGFVHGDPKPSHIRCDSDGQIYVIDYEFSIFTNETMPSLDVDAWLIRTGAE